MPESSVFENYLLKREDGMRRRVDVDVTLIRKLEKISQEYDGSVNKLVNIALNEFLKDKKVEFYERADNETTERHNFCIKKSAYKELEKLKNKYGVSVCKLVNIAIYNALNK